MKVVTSETFDSEVIKSELPVLLDFWAPWCIPCKVLEPIIEKLSTKVRGRVKVFKVNQDETPEIGNIVGIYQIPTLVLYKAGVEVARTGAKSMDEIMDFLKEGGV